MEAGHGRIDVRFHAPPEPLRRYFTSFYRFAVDVPDGTTLTDRLHPEWANLRLITGNLPRAVAPDGTPVAGQRFIVTGPSEHGVAINLGRSVIWGIGLLPLGWAKFVAQKASDFADAALDGETHPAFACFAPMAEAVFGAADEEAQLAAIADYFTAQAGEAHPDETRITAIHTALVDPDVGTVAQLVEAAGLNQRTVERLCDKHFGYSARLLLRRQRFMRSLAQFMLDPSLKWIGAMDGHYHDQAQFVRDFHHFMGMSPREYASQPHPILGAVMKERAKMAGEAVQTLHHPLLGPMPAPKREDD